MRWKRRSVCSLCLLGPLIGMAGLGGCAVGAGPDISRYEAIVASPDRSADDRKADERRYPVQLLAFTVVEPGMKVLDMGAGAGYSSELLARAVAPGGTVFAQLGANHTRFDKRFERSSVRNVVGVVRPPDDPIAADTGPLDLVTMFLTYHDIAGTSADRPRMLQKLFAALKPGGHLVIIDHAANPGSPASVGKSLHRLDENLLKNEVQAAGFRLVGSSDFLRNPDDPRTEPHFKLKIHTDRFALRFLRP